MKKAKITVTITTNELSRETKDQMWAVYQGYYHYSREYFMQRIRRNNYFSFYKADGRIIGFTGLRINRTEVCGKECLLVYFGQTAIDRDYRGNSLIPRTATKLFLRYWKDLIAGRIYVWADSLTYKAYLVFAKTLREYYPNYKARMPEHVGQLIDFIGREYYEETFCPETGTVRKETVFVNDTTTMIDVRQETDPDVLFYHRANPEYINGHGLITMAPMHLPNYLQVLAKCAGKWWKNMTGAKNKSPKTECTLSAPVRMKT